LIISHFTSSAEKLSYLLNKGTEYVANEELSDGDITSRLDSDGKQYDLSHRLIERALNS